MFTLDQGTSAERLYVAGGYNYKDGNNGCGNLNGSYYCDLVAYYDEVNFRWLLIMTK